MTMQTLKLAGKEYVVVPKDEFQELRRQAKSKTSESASVKPRHRMSKQDWGDVAEAKRLAAKNEKTIPLAQLKRELGI